MEYTAEILRLSDHFFEDYPAFSYPEILRKANRPYNCLRIEFHNYYVCIPYRTNMNHKNGYHFKNSERSESHHSGLDYSKIIIVENTSYFDNVEGIVDHDEYLETIRNLPEIVKEVTIYIDDYVHHRKGTVKLHPREFERRYHYSTLPYFENELGI